MYVTSMTNAAKQGAGTMVVADIMSRDVVTIQEEDNLELIGGEMEAFRFRHMPVVDGDRVVGIVSHRDLLRASASVFEPGQQTRTAAIEARFFVADLMTRSPITVRPETPVSEAATIMNDRRVGCLPVTDEHGKLVGIVTSADMVRLVARLT